jgi:hypothetical protein
MDRNSRQKAKTTRPLFPEVHYGADDPRALLQIARKAFDKGDLETLIRCYCPPAASPEELAVARGIASLEFAIFNDVRRFLNKSTKKFPEAELDDALGEASRFFDRRLLMLPPNLYESMAQGEIEIAGDKAYVTYKPLADGGTSKATLSQRGGRWTLGIVGTKLKDPLLAERLSSLARAALAALEDSATADEFKDRIVPHVQTFSQDLEPTRQPEVVKMIKKLGGRVRYDYQFGDDGKRIGRESQRPPVPEWLRELIGVEYVSDVIAIICIEPRFDDDNLEQLSGLTELMALSIGGKQISDAGLAHLKGMTKLQALSILQTQITDAGLEHLKGLANLQELNLVGAEVTDAGLEHLKGLTQLQKLLLDEVSVSSEGVRKLQQALPNCEIGL